MPNSSDKTSSKTSPLVGRNYGDRLEADVIYVEAQRILKLEPVSGATHRHGANSARAETNAKAKIEKPYRRGPYIRY